MSLDTTGHSLSRTSSLLLHPTSAKSRKSDIFKMGGNEQKSNRYPATTRNKQPIGPKPPQTRRPAIGKSKSHSQLGASSSLKRLSLTSPPNNQNFFPAYGSLPSTAAVNKRGVAVDKKPLESNSNHNHMMGEEPLWSMEAKIVE